MDQINSRTLLRSAIWTSEGDWTEVYPGGSTVRIEKTANGVSAFASPFHPSHLQAIRTDSGIHIDWDEMLFMINSEVRLPSVLQLIRKQWQVSEI